MKTYKTNFLIYHNGTKYPAGSKIELEDKFANELLQANCIRKSNETKQSDNNANGKNGQGDGKSQSPSEPKPYEFMTDAEQIEYINKLTNEDLKTLPETFIEMSKTKSKKLLTTRLNILKTGNKEETV